MHGSTSIALSSLLLTSGWARSLHKLHKRYDFDHNGIPDWCFDNGKGDTECLLDDGSWTTFLTPPSSTIPPAPAPTTSSSFTRTRTYTRVRPEPLQSSTTGITTSTTAPLAIPIATSAPGPGLAFNSITSLSVPIPPPATATTSSLSPPSPPLTVSTSSSAEAPSTLPAWSSSTAAQTPSTSVPPTPKNFPTVGQWTSGNGSIWTLEYQGLLQYTETLQTEHLQGDKCRTGSINGRTIWNCGDMQCPGSVNICGFSMGPAFYGTSSPSVVNTDNLTLVNDATFAEPWPSDPTPQAPQTGWGMDTSNVAGINSTHGVAYVWVIWRGASDGSYVDQGLAAVSVTLGDERPIANRVGTYMSSPTALSVGLLGIMADGGYVYSYSIGGPSGVIVSRAPASDAVFDAKQHEFFDYTSQNWTTPGSIPDKTDQTYGVKTADPTGKFNCAVYGSVFWSDAWGKYVILCNIYMMYTSLYVADKPEGPWSATYPVLTQNGYGSHAHPEFGTEDLYWSQGPLGTFDMFKMTVNVS